VADQCVWVTIPDELIEEIAARVVRRVLGELPLAEQGSTGQRSPYMSIPEAAAFLRCSRQRIDDLLSQRLLPRVKDGRRTLIPCTALENYLADREPRKS
jgi:excisionase family DNA binding protein